MAEPSDSPKGQTIPWPEKAETELSPREGWTKQTIKLAVSPGVPDQVTAMVRGEFAVHRMVEDEGFCTTFVADGIRFHSRGRVFARSADAMAVLEQLATVHDDWRGAFDRGLPWKLRQVFNDVHYVAEREGKILRTKVVHQDD